MPAWKNITLNIPEGDLNVSIDQKVASGDIVMILEAMKMETEVRATIDGVIKNISVKEGDVVQVGDILLNLK